MEPKFYQCPICGNVMVKLSDSGVTPSCCGKSMEMMVPRTDDASAGEKHQPVVKQDGQTFLVEVGSVPHPMVDSHFIQWVCLVSERAAQIQFLRPGEKPEARFCCAQQPSQVYAFCNIHGLWRSDLAVKACDGSNE